MTDKLLPPPPVAHPTITVVGIGASAGGLEAFSLLLSGLPEKSGMAFVMVQHLEPTHDSHLTDILSKSTGMPVLEITDGMVVEPDHVYVIPPNSNLALAEGALHLSPRGESRGAHLPIDFFLRSLAQDRQSHSIGVVLSGMGSDGTLGLAEIKSVGGFTFAQDEATSKFPGMPLSAVAYGVVDKVLPPGDIARELGRMGGHSYLGQADSEEAPQVLFSGADEEFARLVELLHSSSGVDFTHYRDTTLKRRIQRRMALCRRENLGDYLKHVEGDPAELKSLYQDILIHVTRFFRDTEVFKTLSAVVLPQIQKTKTAGESIRVWVAGCATGEEAYSLAIALSEFQATQAVRYPLRIFASDISESPSLERTRAGVYPENIEHDVSQERLQRYFTKEGGGYRINKEIREMVIFARHDVSADPPFARLDLISCRNVLIYLSAPLQRRIIPAFHYALNPSGFLLLGTSETIGRDTDLFSPVDAQLKIYSKKMTAIRLPVLASKGSGARAPGKIAPMSRAPTPLDFQQAADRMLLRKFVPPGVLVTRDMDVLQFRGRTSPFLEPPEGGTSLNLTKMAQENLSLELRRAILECEETGELVHRKDVRSLDGQAIRRVNLQIHPIRLPESDETCYLILFEETENPAPPPAPADHRSRRGPTEEEEIGLLRLELAAVREYLQTVREQSEAANEELKSSNEEMESSNEELQSTNEELETAKEESQSANEELATMNEELRTRNLELGQLNDDLSNVLGSVQIPIIMLGSDLCIRRFTPSAGKTLRLVNADIGRPIGNVRLAIPDFDLEKHVSDVISSQKPAALEIRDQAGRWHALKIHPYRSSDDQINGALVVLLDIDGVKRAQHRLQVSGDYSRSIVDTVREPLLILDEDLRIHSANLSYYRLMGTVPQETEGRMMDEVSDGLWRNPELLKLLRQPAESDGGFEGFEMNVFLPGGRLSTLVLNARRLLPHNDRSSMLLLGIEDITDRRRSERDLRLLKYFSDQSPYPFYLMDRMGRFSYVNRSACEKLGYSEAELLTMSTYQVEAGCSVSKYDYLFQWVHLSPVPPFEAEHIAKDGGRYPVECTATGVQFEGEEYMLVVASDITERKKAAEAMQEREEMLRQSQRMEAIGKLAGGVAHDFNNLLTAINGYSALCLEKVPKEGELHDHLDEINRAGERAATLTRQLLAYSRKQILITKVMDLNAVVSNMHSMLSRLIGDNFRLVLALGEGLGMVKADWGQMEQILINLVVNARDALPAGGEITIQTRNEVLDGGYSLGFPSAQWGDYVSLSVGDNGIGMDSEVQKRIFEPFFTTKELGKGTGLGLSVVQGIVAQSGGFITVESKPGRGSLFKILLPKDTIQDASATLLKDAPDSQSKGNETVLLVEDEETVRNFTRKVLELQGYLVLEANDGQSALMVNDQHKDITIQVMLTDMIMPGMSGRELAEEFMATRPGSRVLFMSGHTEHADYLRNGVVQNAVNFIQKPFTPGDMSKAVREALDLVTKPISVEPVIDPIVGGGQGVS